MSNPVWVIQTNQAVRTMSSSGDQKGTVTKKLGFFETIKSLLDREGPAAFWRGIGPALVLVINPILQVRLYIAITAHCV